MAQNVMQNVDSLCIDTIRTLSMDAVQKANSGHPGTPMALAPVMHVIWTRFLRHNPENPGWADRDRFVLSAGHASMLLYSTLHLHGYGVSLDDIKSFRQLGSICAGHPELGLCPGVETTTGPLGQGLANTVGMAVAQKWMAAHYNRPGHDICSHDVIALGGDGDIMEGVSGEAASLAGHLGLDNLTWIYDDNRITIDGATDVSFSEDVPARFRAMGWHVNIVEDANDLEVINSAIERAKAVEGQPSLICLRSHIGWGSPNKQDTADAHGAPLGDEEIRLTKQAYGWDPDKTFHVPSELEAGVKTPSIERGRELEKTWQAKYDAWAAEFPDLAVEWTAQHAGELPEGWDADLPTFTPADGNLAGRAAGSKALAAISARVPWLMGGSADLGCSNKTLVPGDGAFARGAYGERNMYFGIREHAMASICNGMSLSGMRSYAATFFVFSDYCRPVHRLSALMNQPVAYVYTHDSIGVGEDGPTHQPIEHLPSLRALPRLVVLRPGDANECVEAWRTMMNLKDRPAALLLSRQGMPVIDREGRAPASDLAKGAYVLTDCDGTPDVILMASGTELSLVMEAGEKLAADGVKARVVSFPSWELFADQDAAYRESVLPAAVTARVAIEAASTFGWERYVGMAGVAIGRDDFGESAPGGVLMEHFGFTVDAVVEAARSQL